jgi:NTP pyrophosphatase (non-canonical NTP hydrolase)
VHRALEIYIQEERKMETPQTITEWQQAIGDYVRSSGWRDKPRSFGESIALVHTELSEAFEEFRHGRGVAERYYSGSFSTDSDGRMIESTIEPAKPEGIPSELADVMIRILDMADEYGIDLQEVMLEKHRYNQTRGYRHGGKVA